MDKEMNSKVRIYTCICLSVSVAKGTSRIHLKERNLPSWSEQEGHWVDRELDRRENLSV